jgi:hypothetical protein
MVNGPAWKALIEEEFGDGIMSAIDFTMQIEREPDPKGDRVRIAMSGKFLPSITAPSRGCPNWATGRNRPAGQSDAEHCYRGSAITRNRLLARRRESRPSTETRFTRAGSRD